MHTGVSFRVSELCVIRNGDLLSRTLPLAFVSLSGIDKPPSDKITSPVMSYATQDVMACAPRDEMDSLFQVTLDFISSYDLPSIHHSSVQAETEVLQMIDEHREMLAFGDDLDLSSEDDVSLTANLNEFPSDDVRTIVDSAPWPEMSSQPTTRRRRGAPRKEEIAELRKLATVLSDKLEAMKASRAKLLAATKKGTDTNVLEKTLWKNIATRQLALRRSSEEDNEKLRGQVAGHAKYAANLKRMLKRRYSEEMLEMVPLENRVRNVSWKTSPDNARVFKELLEGTEHIYAGVDALIAKKNMANLSCPGRSHKAYPDTVNGMFIELVDKNQVPFTTNNTANAVWKALYGKKACDGDIVDVKMCMQDMKQTDDVITSYMSYICNTPGHSSFVQESRVGRKYVDDERVVFVCRGLTEPSCRSVGSLGLLFQETAVIVVRKGQTLASGQETAFIESYVWVTRCDDGKEAALQFREPTYMDIASKGWNKKLSLYSILIENILFNEALNM